jgi:hypothetical protein
MATTWPSIISTASRSNSRTCVRTALRAALLLTLVVGSSLSAAWTCPFCTAQKPTLCQQQAAAAVTALGEVEANGQDGRTTVNLHRVISGAGALPDTTRLSVPLDLATKPGALLLLFGTRSGETKLEWHAVAVDEVSYAYFARAPSLKTSTEQRLAYFAPLLENSNPLVAEDAYLEFAHAPFEQVAAAAELLPMQRIATWLVDPTVPAHRKGFYGLALGLAQDPKVRQANAAHLRELILAPEDDFRSGFDGILGGYLLLEGLGGLDLVESRYFANAQAAVGDVRHALTALRFYHEYGHEISPQQLSAAVRKLLVRPEFAEAAIVDLARWQAWDALSAIANLYGDREYAEPATQRAIVGYLLACPLPAARDALHQLRERDPQGVAAAEAVLSRTGSVPQNE